MGLTEKHWFEDEEPELTEQQLEDIVYENKKAYNSGYIKGFHDAKIEFLTPEKAEQLLKDCPYRGCETGCIVTIAKDAIARLKEQEAVRPVKQTEQTEWTVCGNCRNHIISKWIFCPYCGRSAKWE